MRLSKDEITVLKDVQDKVYTRDIFVKDSWDEKRY